MDFVGIWAGRFDDGGRRCIERRGGLTLPCPDRARGAAGVRGGAACPGGARALWEGARRLGYGMLVSGGSIFACKGTWLWRAGTVAGHIVSSGSARFAMRRGYGGLCPHPLKGHWPLRIPLAAAQNSLSHNESRAAPARGLPGGLCTCFQSKTQPRNPAPFLSGRGFAACSRQRWKSIPST